jgi:hypothetical protein
MEKERRAELLKPDEQATGRWFFAHRRIVQDGKGDRTKSFGKSKTSIPIREHDRLKKRRGFVMYRLIVRIAILAKS